MYELVEGREIHPSAVADRYGLDAGDVYRALAYYHDHEEEMASVRGRRERTIEKHRADALTPNDYSGSSSK